MCRARINEIRESKLFYPAQSLKGPSLDHSPQNILEFVGLEFDKVMQWVANALPGKHQCSYFVPNLKSSYFCPDFLLETVLNSEILACPLTPYPPYPATVARIERSEIRGMPHPSPGCRFA